MNSSNIKVVNIGDRPQILQNVIDLWRANSNTLGFFPEGAFNEHAAKKWILVATEDDALAGYLLYRITGRHELLPRAAIVHLCVSEKHRGKGIARLLVDALYKSVKSEVFKIVLTCRRDYNANSLWPELGFVYRGERKGRSNKPLALWQMQLRKPPLLALIDSKAEEGINTLPVVLDANVLYRLQDPVPQDEPSQRVMSEEARSLEADWLGDGIQLLITPELFNELQRQEDEDLRKSRLCFANRYRKVNTTLEETRRWEHEIQVLFPENPNDNTKSDIRQLAYAAASDVAFFITQDQGILKRSDTVYQKSGLRILAPGQLVGRLDEAIREVEYRPKRLAGTSTLMNSRLHSNQVTNLYPHLRCLSRQEKIHEFESKLRAFMAQPDRYSIQVILRKDGPPLALIVYDTDNPQELSIPMFRVSRSSIASTVLRYVLGKIVLRSASEKRQITRLHSDCANEDFRRSLRELGFAPVDDHWIKINLPSIKYSNALIKELQYIGEKFVIAKPLARALSTSIKEAVDQNDTLALVDIERRLWPAKVRDAPVENFIVPIKPYWAQHLFDEGIAQQTLWGAKESLVLSNENVYYRKVQNSRGISAPARILWYVTSGKPSYLTKQVRACSILDEVIVGRPSDLFRRFERLGVYEWQHLRELVEGNLDKNIMALKFSNTELFQEPVSLDGVREILQEVEGKSPQPLSPQRISTKAFALIYLMSSDV